AGIYLSPGEAFAAITRRPRFWLPLLGYLALLAAFTAVWLHQMEPAQFLRNQLEESGKWERIPPESRDIVLTTQAKFFPVIAWAATLVGSPLSIVLMASVLLFIFRVPYGGEVTFTQSMAVVSFSFLATHLLTTPLIILVMALKGDWNLNPQEALQANPTLLLDRADVAKPLYALAGSLDLISFWQIGLLAVGFAVASRRGVKKTVWGVVVPWALLVLGKVVVATFL
ncbi:MAG TPA: YIP1 family protein, partial [Vicinamibacteria bacterium]|nr:YIP1 family protein [Vicinamibacteria bacterium]